MGFGEVWMKWMEALMFSSQMLVLVNGNPTKDFIVEGGSEKEIPFLCSFS